MKRYIKEVAILLLQILLFYAFPLTAGPTDAMGMVFLIICGTFALALILGAISDNTIKLSYPSITALVFIPSVFIYYNESALIHAVWYLVISSVGLGLGSAIRRFFFKIQK